MKRAHDIVRIPSYFDLGVMTPSIAEHQGRRKRIDAPSFSTWDSRMISSPSVPPGRRNSVEMFTLTPVGGGRPEVVSAREAMESVN